ncbi:MAG: hypothetical protein AAF847_05295 [Bacteroidota bacterium]
MDINTAGLRPNEIEELKEFAAMGFEFNKDAFSFTSYSGESSHKNIDYTIFHRLNEQIDLEDFGTGIENIGFAFIALPPTTFAQDQGIEYYPNYREISIGLSLNYEQFVEATPEAALEMMKTLYLTGLRVLLFFDIRDFDMEGLIAAVEQAFEEEDEQKAEEATM